MGGSTVSLLLIITWTTCLVHAQSSVGSQILGSFRCPLVDQDGTAPDGETSGTAFFTCVYPAAGKCTYFVSDGSLSSGTELCPPEGASAAGCDSASCDGAAAAAAAAGTPKSAALAKSRHASTFPAATPAGGGRTSTASVPNTSLLDSGTLGTSTSQSDSASAQSNSAVSSASITEKAAHIPPTSQGSALASASAKVTKHRKRIPPRVIAAICVAVTSVIVGLTIALLLCAKHRRRAAKHGATAVDRNANTVSPFTLVTEMDGRNTSPRDSNIRSVSPNTITQQGLETELRMVNEKMADLQDLERSSTTADSGTRRMSGLISMRSSSRRGVPDVEAQLEASREQINMLVTRMQALEATTNSAYGAGISNEPPPAYV